MLPPTLHCCDPQISRAESSHPAEHPAFTRRMLPPCPIRPIERYTRVLRALIPRPNSKGIQGRPNIEPVWRKIVKTISSWVLIYFAPGTRL